MERTMSRPFRNELTIEPMPTLAGQPARFRLFGRLNGKEIRKRGTDPLMLAKLKDKLLGEMADAVTASQPFQIHRTRLTELQLLQAEQIFGMIMGRDVDPVELIRAGMGVMGDGKPKDCMESLTDWQADRTRKFKSAVTESGNRNRVKQFLALNKAVKFLSDITPKMVVDFAYREHLTATSSLSVLRPVKAWLNYCVSRKWLKVSPVQLNNETMHEEANRDRNTEDRILTPDQCEKLLRAAESYHNGEMLPFIALSLWCMMRKADVLNLDPKHITLGDKPRVSVMARKKGSKFRVVTIPANMVPVIKDCFARGLLTEGKKIAFTRFGLDAIRLAAGLQTREEVTKGETGRGKIVSSVWTHNVMRHTGESYLYNLTGDIADVTRQAGNSEDIAFRHYLQLPQDGDAARFYGITGKHSRKARIASAAA